MSYQALARKWRPRQFADVVGQEHVLRPLVNALDHDRLHHAFLFAGTRGVGKTTIARILAKALNCEQGVSAKPCGECSACQALDEGRFVDLIEVDAASRTKVDDTRELLENVQYAPTRGRYKVYLIDEVHMLSGHSFNALLKTLEEPPPHVKFLFATTDPQKLPITVLSRCLQFNLKPLLAAEIGAQLTQILNEEAIAFDAPSVELIARAADGSMRDALSLLDQAIAHGGGAVGEADVRSMLGTIETDHVRALLESLAAGDADGVLAVVAQMADRLPNFSAALDELLLALYHISLAQLVPDALADRAADGAFLRDLATRMAKEDVQLFYQIGLLGKRDLPLAPDPRSGFEMVLLRMLAFHPAEPVARVSSPAVPKPVASPGAAPGEASAQPAAAEKSTRAAVTATEPAQNTTDPIPPAPPPAAKPDTGDWSSVVNDLNLTGLVKEMASHTSLASHEGDKIVLVLDEACHRMLTKEREVALAEALREFYGRDVTLRISTGTPPVETPAQYKRRLQDEEKQAALEAITADDRVQAMINKFDAKVQTDSVRRIDQSDSGNS